MDSEWDLWLIKFPKILAESGTNRLVKQRFGYTSPQIEHRKPKNFSPKKKTLNEEHFRTRLFWVFFRIFQGSMIFREKPTEVLANNRVENLAANPVVQN